MKTEISVYINDVMFCTEASKHVLSRREVSPDACDKASFASRGTENDDVRSLSVPHHNQWWAVKAAVLA